MAGVSGLAFEAIPEKIITEARKDIGMPYSLNRGVSPPSRNAAVPSMAFIAVIALTW